MIKTLPNLFPLCIVVASIFAAPVIAAPERPFDRYGNICWEDEMARLDNFAIELQNDPEAVGYIIVYDGQPSCREEAIARAIRAKNYVVRHRGIERKRVVWRYGGQLEELTTWLQPIPRGAPELVDPSSSATSVNKSGNCKAKIYRRKKCGKL